FDLRADLIDFNILSVFIMSTIISFVPTLLIAVVMFIITPIYFYQTDEKLIQKGSNKRIFLLFFIIILFLISHSIQQHKSQDLSRQNKFQAVKLFMNYSDKYLNYKNLNEITIDELKKTEVKVPLLYTKHSFEFSSLEEADKFCKSIGASVPNHLEVYDILFNRFDVWGEKYYWTSDIIDYENLVLHFKNMNYEIIKKPENVKIFSFCSEVINDPTGYTYKDNFYKVHKYEQKQEKKHFKFPLNPNKVNIGIFKTQSKPSEIESEIDLSSDKKVYDDITGEISRISFDVKYVPLSYFNELVKAGYSYNPDLTVNNNYEVTNYGRKYTQNSNNIRYCAFPSIDYGSLSMYNEREIWIQNFCSPSFYIINTSPVLKAKSEKDAYCYANGGRLPNIPELFGILRTYNKEIGQNNKYWTRNYITLNDVKTPVYVYRLDENNIGIGLGQLPYDSADTYCIKKAEKPSIVISNFKSKFPSFEGSSYAKNFCSNCKYYEMPDVMPIK
ncbi:hypothetical protein II906_03010, partial [bacterium]|nr:hypothetical protein [bacterium]